MNPLTIYILFAILIVGVIAVAWNIIDVMQARRYWRKNRAITDERFQRAKQQERVDRNGHVTKPEEGVR